MTARSQQANALIGVVIVLLIVAGFAVAGLRGQGAGEPGEVHHRTEAAASHGDDGRIFELLPGDVHRPGPAPH